MRNSLLFILFAVLSTLPYGSAWGTTGTLPITTSTTLTEDHQGSIIIAADGVVLDCAGHTVMGDESGIGIQLIGITGATVTNCRVTRFLKGFFLQAASNNILLLNVVSNNTEEGFDIERSVANIFINNIVTENTRDGFDLGDSNDNIFLQNDITRNTLNGLELDRSNGNIILENTTTNNGRDFQNGNIVEERSGISLDSSNNNFLRGNVSNSNTRNGFRLDASSDNTLVSNRASGNEGRDRAGVVDQADCKQIPLPGQGVDLTSVRNQFMNNLFANPDGCIFLLPGD